MAANRREKKSANLAYYRVFYEVAATGSVTGAAKVLGVTQPAVSQQIRQLEEFLSVRLFERTGRGVRLTGEGKVLFDYVKRASKEFEQGEKKLQQMRDLDIGEVCIGASDLALRFFLLSYLARFHEAYQGVQVKVTCAPSPETLSLLQDGGIDFGLVTGPLPSRLSGVDVLQVGRIHDIFIGGKRYAGLASQPVSLKRLKELPLICLDTGTASRRALDQYLAGNHVQVNPVFELADSDSIVDFTAQDLGIGCIAEDFARGAIEEKRVFPITLEEAMPERSLYAATLHGRTLPSAAVKLLAMIRGEEKENEKGDNA